MKHIQNAAKNIRVVEHALKNSISNSLSKIAVTLLLCVVSACGFDAEPPSVESGVHQNAYAEVTHGAGVVCSNLEDSGEVLVSDVNCLVSNVPPAEDSTACVDGRCCDTACDDVCQACDMDSRDGVEEGAGYCKAIGGAGVGEGVEDSTPRFGPACGADARCENGDRVGNSLCRGINGCEGGAIQDCGLYACVEAEEVGVPAPFCNTDCSEDTDCATDAWCYGPESVCTNLAHVGDPCTNAAQCASHACVDGICCATACEDECYSCNVDYTGEANGECAVVEVDKDPGNDCADAGAPSCGLTGQCDGGGTCKFYDNGTVCSAAICSDGDAQGNSTCIAQNCTAPTPVDCQLYACENSTCNDSCVDDGDCNAAAGARCYGGVCTDLLLDGEACTQGPQCASTNCVDGVCCDTGCDSLCQGCIQSATGFGDGICSNVLSGQDIRNVCADESVSSCGQDGECDGSGACRLYSNGVICAAETCSGGDRLPESACLNQSCTPPQTVDCGSYACVDAACNTTCSQDIDCAVDEGGWCYVPLSMCSDLKHNGDACTANLQCASNFCVDGVCCDGACGSACESCVETYTGIADGECGDVLAGNDPGNDCSTQGVHTCGQNGFCDGSGACQPYPDSTVCGAAVCIGGDSRDASTCQGGSCVIPTPDDCELYACRTAECLDSCANTGDCNWQESAYCYTASEICTDLGNDGASCTDGTQCASGFCVDGVCCDGACTSTCEACISSATGWADGRCKNVLNGQDPRNVCSDQNATSCGTDGVCDGGGSCRIYADGTVCAGPQCSGNDVYGDSACLTGSCTLPDISECGTYGCNDGVCLTTCTTDAQCDEANGAWCNDGVCTDKKHPGDDCGAHSECADNYCVGGVCCDGPCSGGCSSCNSTYTGQAAGVCGAVTSGTDPQNACEDGGAASCGNSGQCNGSGSCSSYANGTVCQAGACVNGDWNGDSLCSGGGCSSPATQDCGLYACTSSGCLNSCTGDGQCAQGSWCFNGECTDKNHPGDSCNNAAECASGFCTDNVCCNTSCSSTCQSCLNAETNLSDGTCGFILEGTDPGSECAEQGVASCGLNGYCNGIGSCDSYEDNEVCGVDACSGANVVSGGVCASGSCTAGAITDCGAYGCLNGECRNSCTTDSHCDTGNDFWCYDGSCTDKNDNGETCGSNGQCASGYCVDGMCCSTACDSGCVACRQTYTGVSNGTCGNVNGGSDPYNSCVDQGSASCAQNGSCNGAGGCSLYGNGTTCSAAYCSGHNIVAGAVCSGGSCGNNSPQDCGAYTCRNNACLTSCTSTNDCDTGNGYWCNGSECTNLKPQGETCSANSQCATGNCVDGYCCDSACSSSCQSCANASTGWGNGTCAYVTAGNDPRSDCSDQGVATCGQDGACDGSGGCRAYSAGTTCTDNCCDGNNEQPDSYCSGGSCFLPSSTSCGDYICESCACRNNCSDDTHCAGSARCTNGACALNQGPTADQYYYSSVLEDSSNTSFNATGSDPEGDALDFLLYSQPGHGSVSNWNENNGSFKYTPTSNYCGWDGFYFRVYDGEFYSDWAYYYIWVTCQNDAPTISGISNQSMDWRNGTKSVSISVSDIDTSISSLTITADSSADWLIPDSWINPVWTGSSWRLDINAQAQVGNATITVDVNDGSGGSTYTSFNMSVTGAAQCECECAGIIDFYGICIGCWNWPPWECQRTVPSDCYDYSNSVQCDGP